MSASPPRLGTGLAYGLRRVCAAWGMARSSFYAMTSGQHAEQPDRQSVEGPKPAISDQALLVAIEADLEASPRRSEGEGYRKVLARLRKVCRDIRVDPASGCVDPDAREQSAQEVHDPSRCRRRGGNPHDGEIITHAPNLMWGTDGVRVVHGGRRLGPGSSPHVEHWNAEQCRLACLISAATASPPCSRSPWGLPACMDRRRPARLGGWPCGWITAPSICRTTSPTRSKSAGRHPAVLRLRRRAPDQRRLAERFNRTLKEQIIHGRIYRNIAELRTPSATSSNSTMPSGSSKRTGYLSPAQAQSGVARGENTIRPAA